jgi:polysaccharide biosynthesis transport protein
MNDLPAPVTENRSVRSARFQNHLHRFKNQLRRRWWVVPLLVFAALGVQAYRLWTAPPAYTSVGKMIVNIKIQTQAGTGTTYMEELSNFLTTQVALMRSSTVLNRAVERVRSLKPDLKQCPVQPQFNVIPKTTMFDLRVVGEEPEYTAAYLQACMEEYINLKKEMRGTASESTLSGIMAELSRLEKDLRRGEDELLAFQSSNSVVFLQEQGNSAASYLSKLTSQQAGLQSELELLRSLSLEQNLERQQKKGGGAMLDDPTGAGDSLSTLIGADSDYLKIRQEIQLLKAEQKELSEYLRPKHPKMIDLQDKLTQKEKLLEIFKDQSREQLANRQNSIEIQIASLKKGITEWETRSLDVSRKMAEYQKIKANNTRVQGLYDRLQATMQSLATDKDISPESVTILERASTAVPNTDDAVKSILIGAATGLVLAFGLLLLLDRFDDRVTSFTDLQDIFDEPVLCQVPREISLNENGKLDLIHPQDDRHAFAEAYRNLRSSLLYMGENGKMPPLLLVTSSIPSEGKSITAANLGITLAESGTRVLLMDADLRKGTLHEHFNKPVGPGLTEILSREADWKSVVHLTDMPNLSVITRGGTARNPSELFLGPTTKNLFAELHAAFDLILLDTAPVMAADDVATLAPLADGVVFVIRANFTSARVARAALDLLYQRRVNILGLALNSVAADSSEYYYYKYKSYYTDSPKRAK